MAITRVLIILLGVFGTIIPFVGPLFGFGMGPESAGALTTSKLIYHLIPGAVVILGGLMLFPSVRASRVLGAMLAILGGIWLTLAPMVLGGTTASPTLVELLSPLAYHYGTGLLITAIAAFALGRMTGERTTIEQAEPKQVAEESGRKRAQRVR